MHRRQRCGTFESSFHFHLCFSSSASTINTSLQLLGRCSMRQTTGQPAWLTSTWGLRWQAAGSSAIVSKWTGLNGFESAVNSQPVLAFSLAVAIATLSILFPGWKRLHKLCSWSVSHHTPLCLPSICFCSFFTFLYINQHFLFALILVLFPSLCLTFIFRAFTLFNLFLCLSLFIHLSACFLLSIYTWTCIIISASLWNEISSRKYSLDPGTFNALCTTVHTLFVCILSSSGWHVGCT